MSISLHPMQDLPPRNGKYLVKFYNSHRPEYDCTEIVWRTFEERWQDIDYYIHPGDGYEAIGWFDRLDKE